MRQTLPPEHYARVQDDLRGAMEKAGLDALLLDDHHDVAWATGFFHFPNERPAAVWVSAQDCLLLVPELEADHAARQRAAAGIVAYPEFPGPRSPFAALFDRVKPKGRIAYAPSAQAGRLAEWQSLAQAEWIMDDVVGRARLVKYPGELALHREAARISDAMIVSGLDLIREALAQGAPLPSEAELAGHVTGHGRRMMFEEHEDVVIGQMLSGGLVYTGANASFPHGLPGATRVQRGDTFILSLGCAVGGRFAESERTFVLGEPTREQRRYFDAVEKAQHEGTEALTAGAECRAANRLCLDLLREAGMADYIRHRQGHGIGVWLHEPPWIEDGDASLLRPGMVVSSEPGLYIPGHGGYRISDTVLITEAGPERLTTHPRRLDDCVIA